MDTPQQHESDVFDIRRLLDTARQSRLCCLAFALVVALLSALVIAPLFSQEHMEKSVLASHVDTQLARAAGVFALAKGINAVVSLAQSLQISFSAVVAGMSFEPFQLLDPLNSFIERVSDWCMLAIGSLLLEKLLLKVNIWLAFVCIIPCSMGLLALSAFTGPMMTQKLRVATLKLLVLGITVGVFVPVSIQCSRIVEQSILKKTIAENVASLEKDSAVIDAVGGQLAELQEVLKQSGGQEASPPEKSQEKQENRGLWDRTKERASGVAAKAGEIFSPKRIGASISEQLHKMRTAIENTTMAFLQLLAVFVITTLIIPIASMLGLWVAVRWLFNLPLDRTNIGMVDAKLAQVRDVVKTMRK